MSTLLNRSIPPAMPVEADAARLDVVLLHHPTTNVNRPILVPAMGLFSLADRLERNGFGVRILHLGLEKVVDPNFNLPAFLKQHGTRVAAMSVHWFFQLPDSLATAKALKETVPGLTVVLGGFSASLFAESIVADHPYVDAVIRGDGERPLEEFCRACIENGSRDWSAIPNLVYRGPRGAVRKNPFSYRISAEEFADCRFSNLKLLSHHEVFVNYPYSPTRRFEGRLKIKAGHIFPLEVGRGCPYLCTFCGGNREAQVLINNRKAPVFRPVESVVKTMAEAASFGYRNFYMSYDPAPNGDYFLSLFDAIRRQGMKVGLVFGCWGLPDPRFLEAFKATFTDGMLEISPETGDERLRKLNKGPLSYTNAELEDCLTFMDRIDIPAQLFFGFFLAGDTVESVSRTMRYAHRMEDEHTCESFYLAFSSDPASLLQLHPERYDMTIRTSTLPEYLAALSEGRSSSNMLAHQPAALDDATVNALVYKLNADQLAYKVLPLAIRALRLMLGGRAPFEEAMDRFLADISAGAAARDAALGLDQLVAAFKRTAGACLSARSDGAADLLMELIDYESAPYDVLDKQFKAFSLHYSLYCEELRLPPDGQAAFAARQDVKTARRSYRFDVLEGIRHLAENRCPAPARSAATLEFVVAKSGQYIVHCP